MQMPCVCHIFMLGEREIFERFFLEVEGNLWKIQQAINEHIHRLKMHVYSSSFSLHWKWHFLVFVDGEPRGEGTEKNEQSVVFLTPSRSH